MGVEAVDRGGVEAGPVRGRRRAGLLSSSRLIRSGCIVEARPLAARLADTQLRPRGQERVAGRADSAVASMSPPEATKRVRAFSMLRRPRRLDYEAPDSGSRAGTRWRCPPRGAAGAAKGSSLK